MKAILLACALLFLFSCKRKPIVIINPVILPESYLPTTTGSTWEYQLGGLLSSINTVTATSRDTTFSNFTDISFNVLNVNNSGEDYQTKKGNDYYMTVPGSSINRPYKIIKGDAVINEKWIGAVNGTDTYFVQLLEKDIVYQLDTAKFEKTLHLKQTRVNGTNTNMTLDTWVAYNVGFIYTDGNVSGFPYSSKLIKASVK
jgi:hypothetical protein